MLGYQCTVQQRLWRAQLAEICFARTGRKSPFKLIELPPGMTVDEVEARQ
jgi:hypothetical protein